MKPLKGKLSLEQDQQTLIIARATGFSFSVEKYLDRQLTYPLLDIFHEDLADTLSNWMWSDLYEASL